MENQGLLGLVDTIKGLMTDDKGLFQGGRQGLPLGRLSDFMQGKSFNNPVSKTGGWSLDTPYSSSPYQGHSWDNRYSPITHHYNTGHRLDMGNFEDRNYLQRANLYNDGSTDLHLRRLKHGDGTFTLNSEDYEKYGTYHPNFIQQGLDKLGLRMGNPENMNATGWERFLPFIGKSVESVHNR
jgi:hypothetical protein